jgi:hypothetical protein
MPSRIEERWLHVSIGFFLFHLIVTIALRTASDGSVENEKGYHGWIVATLDNATIIEGHGPTEGRIKDTT